MYDILNPVHYIAANNPDGVISVLVKYNLPAPRNHSELATASSFAASQIGEPFLRDIAQLHPDKDYLLSISGIYQYRPNYKFSNLVDEPYKTSVANLTIDQLSAEIDKLSYQLNQEPNGSPKIVELQEKIAYLQKQLVTKQASTIRDGSTTPGFKIDLQKQTHTMLLIMLGITLMFFGSKIFKQA